MKSIEYLRPSTAMIISLKAAYAGGALVFTTKDACDIREWDTNLFIREFNPMGFQRQPEVYKPHYIYDPTSDNTIINATWLPYVAKIDELPDQNNSSIQIEGIANGFIPVLIRKDSYKMSFANQ